MDDLTPTRILGLVCVKHPELNGLRRLKNRECIGCKRDRRQAYKKRPEQRQKKYAAQRNVLEMGRVAKKMQDRAVQDIRIRACEIASREVHDVSRWQEFLQQAQIELLK